MTVFPFAPTGFEYVGSTTSVTQPLIREFPWFPTISGYYQDMASALVGVDQDITGRLPCGFAYPLPLNFFNGAATLLCSPIGAIQGFRYQTAQGETFSRSYVAGSSVPGTMVYAMIICDPNAIYKAQFTINAPLSIGLTLMWGSMINDTYYYSKNLLAADGTTTIEILLIEGKNEWSRQGLQLCGNGAGSLKNINNQFVIQGFATGEVGDTYPWFNVVLAQPWLDRNSPYFTETEEEGEVGLMGVEPEPEPEEELEVEPEPEPEPEGEPEPEPEA